MLRLQDQGGEEDRGGAFVDLQSDLIMLFSLVGGVWMVED